MARKGSQNPSKIAGRVQILAGRYPKDRRFLLVIQDVTPLPAVQNIHPTDRLYLADSPQVSLGGFQVLMPKDHF
jgi:hypothetical protein